jgi:transcriptional regulator with XRE-family HTH domain
VAPTTDDPASIADELRERRLRAGLTQAELAARAGVSITSVQHAEQGRPPRSRSHALRLVRGVLDDLAA